jgi:hypothetical protein
MIERDPAPESLPVTNHPRLELAAAWIDCGAFLIPLEDPGDDGVCSHLFG